MGITKDNTAEVLQEVDNQIIQRLGLSCLLVERTAKQIVLVDTGTLKRSIISNWYGAGGTRSVSWSETKSKKTGKRVKAGETSISPPSEKRGIAGTNIEYGPYVETYKSYLRAALHASMGRIRKIFGAK
jgi:hypothetical protein